MPEIKNHIALAMIINEEDISIKVTTNKTSGSIGQEERVDGYAFCLLQMGYIRSLAAYRFKVLGSQN